MNPKRTVMGLAVIATAGIIIPLGTGATASAAQTHPVIATASPMAAAFGTAVHGTAAQTKNTSRIACDFGGDIGGGDFGGDISGSGFDAGGDISGAGVGGDGTVSDAGGGSASMSVAQSALAGAMAGAVGGAMSAFANNAFAAANAETGTETSHSDSVTAFD